MKLVFGLIKVPRSFSGTSIQVCTGQPEHFECVGIFDAERDAGIGDKDPRLGVWVGPFVRDEDVLADAIDIAGKQLV